MPAIATDNPANNTPFILFTFCFFTCWISNLPVRGCFNAICNTKILIPARAIIHKVKNNTRETTGISKTKTAFFCLNKTFTKHHVPNAPVMLPNTAAGNPSRAVSKKIKIRNCFFVIPMLRKRAI